MAFGIPHTVSFGPSLVEKTTGRAAAPKDKLGAVRTQNRCNTQFSPSFSVGGRTSRSRQREYCEPTACKRDPPGDRGRQRCRRGPQHTVRDRYLPVRRMLTLVVLVALGELIEHTGWAPKERGGAPLIRTRVVARAQRQLLGTPRQCERFPPTSLTVTPGDRPRRRALQLLAGAGADGF